MSYLHHLLRKHETALFKTASYYVVHVVVAILVAYAVTGDWLVALTLSLLEPSVQAVAYFVHDKVWAKVPVQRFRTLIKTASYYGVHLVVAAAVAYAVTRNWVAALTLSLLEPTVQMLFFFVHEKLWDWKTKRKTRACIAPAGCPHAHLCQEHCALQHMA